MGLHTIILDATNEKRIYIAISAAGTFRSDDAADVEADQQGAAVAYMPDQDAEVGHCVHHVAMHARSPKCFLCRSTGRDAQRRRRRKLARGERNLPTDFGFVIDVHAHEPETLYVVPIKSDSEHFPIDGKLRVYRSRSGATSGAAGQGLPERIAT